MTTLYLDASALVKRYVAEPGSELVVDAMQTAEAWATCRIAYVEVARAVHLAAGRPALARFRRDWPSFEVVEVNAELAESAAELTLTSELRSLDAMHLAAAMVLPDEPTVATWDVRLHRAATEVDLETLPKAL